MTAPKGYSARQIRLHWIVTALIVLQFLLHDPMSEAWDTARPPAFIGWFCPMSSAVP